MLTLFRNRLFLAVASGHFVVDTLNSIVPVLLAVLAGSLDLTNGQIGLALTLFTFAGSLSQPLFGWLADRFHGRPTLLAGAGTAWIALWFFGVTLAHSWPLLLACLLIGVLGSGLFHPIGTSAAAAAHPKRAGSATALFFFCGQIGLALGPLIARLENPANASAATTPRTAYFALLDVILPPNYGLNPPFPCNPPRRPRAKRRSRRQARSAALGLRPRR